MAEQKTEVEFAGVKFRGGKMFAIILALSTLAGGLYGAFEFYKDYMNMRTKIESYVAPDLSGFDKRLEVIVTTMTQVEKSMGDVRVSVEEVRDYARANKNDLKDDFARLETIVDRMEDKVNTSETKVREMIDIAEQRFENKRDALQNDYDAKADTIRSDTERKLNDVESRLNKKLQRALDNPLAN
jgi:hypothetical protein